MISRAGSSGHRWNRLTRVAEVNQAMPKTDARYRLVIFDRIDDPLELRDWIAGATGQHPTDVVQWLAKAPGLWPHPLEQQVVRKVLDGLYDFGVAAEAWRSDQFPELGLPRTIHKAACLADGLRIEGLRGEPAHWVPWDRVEMICAGTLGVEDQYRDVRNVNWPSAVVAGIRALAFRKPRGFERHSRASRVSRDPVGEVLIVRREPRITFRVVENQMNYAYLGPALRSTAAENFPIFVADLCARAEHAFITPSTRSFLERRHPSEHEFPNSAAVLDYATHRLLWSWYRRDGDSQLRHQGDDQDDQKEDASGPTSSTEGEE